MKIVGTVGRIGSGKDTVVEYLRRRCGIPVYSIGDMVRAAAKEEGIEISRESLQGVVRREMEKYGKDIFARRLVRRIDEDKPDSAAISGIRSPHDAEILRGRLGRKFLLVHVETKDPEIRFRRLKKRREPRDPDDFEDFLVHDWREEELFHIGETLQTADITIFNEGSLKQLHRQIEEKIMDGFLKKTT